MLPVLARAAEPGRALYQTYCASCHGANGSGSSIAPALLGKSASDVHLMLDTGRMPASVPYVDSIQQSPRFTYAQMAQLVAYVESLSPHPDASLPLIMPGNAARGRALFVERCAGCHGAAADGASVGANDVAPPLRNATGLQVGEAIRAGPGVMPRFGPDVLSDRDVDDIARYVNLLQADAGASPEDRGGVALGHVGPVAEGFVAWFFGIGFLLLAVRAIGALADRKGA
jgi:ubiquinol-cytochrome c reductase cytochrome c subunit